MDVGSMKQIARAGKTLSHYTDEDLHTNVTDLLADLRMYCHVYHINFDACNDRAGRHFEAEREELGEAPD